ncbi:RusA family crossover junction endodeoxyribonuclease [Rhodopseudomonas palustris]|uniref:RusA family crossover junction endodeoxyribonuclease n=1 Tax=Rhodopseudomonas palustris TaxID=1076 RepID=UPI000D1B38D6|nr:RusA family crossover junction endodeoxyribonuclease [Rhodopseudomonas palustris]AVT83677.1 hypothetical protein RPYSC3_48170 [Rhodopseudomonas palustris]
MKTIALKGEPKSTQHLYKMSYAAGYPKIYMTNEGKALKDAYQWQAKIQWVGKPSKERIALHVTYFFGSKRLRDLDNMNKLTLDALTGIVYEDDSQIDELHIYRAYDKECPRIAIAVVEIGKDECGLSDDDLEKVQMAA